jgi:ABC-type multidrug transport system ATPase subunit
MKMMTVQQINQFADVWLEKLDITTKKNAYVGTLSGGQKRKLQLMLAVAGDTKLLLLDEPSSGMDPTARRETWGLLRSLAKDRIIILTTHYMDEADALGDRIAVMSRGKLKTCGSSLFLKQRFGTGVVLEVVPLDKKQSMKPLEQLISQPSLIDGEGLRAETEVLQGQYDESDQYVIKLSEAHRSNFA